MVAAELHDLWLESLSKPARMGGAYGCIMQAFAKAPKISSTSATTTRSSLYETRSLYRWVSHRNGSRPLSARPTCRFSAARRQRLQQLVHGFSAAIRWLSLLRTPLKKELISSALLQMPRCFCHSCEAPLHATDKHGECVSCLGTAHDEIALTGTECHHCGDMCLSSLHSRLAFFSESNHAPRDALLIFSSQGPSRKKQRGRGSQRPGMSELTPAVPPFTSLSTHRKLSPVLFTRLDQYPSAATSDLEVHNEITKFWCAHNSSCLRASSSSALTLVDGTEEKVYDSLPPLDESVAVHLWWLMLLL